MSGLCQGFMFDNSINEFLTEEEKWQTQKGGRTLVQQIRRLRKSLNFAVFRE